MSQWIKNILSGSLKFGLEMANHLALNMVTMIFNQCARRILKTDMENIVEKNECKDNLDIFHLYPMQIKEIEQDIGVNTLKIENGSINGLIVSIPWKAMLNTNLSDSININVDTVNLTTLLSRSMAGSIMLNPENSNSYFSNSKTDISENQELFEVFKEIKSILATYFNKTNLKINTIELMMVNHFKLIINVFEYTNGIITINKLSIHPLTDLSIISLEANQIKYILTGHLTIGSLFINNNITDCVPDIYIENSKSNLELNISVETLTINHLVINGLIIEIKSNQFTINQFTSFTISDFLQFKKSDDASNFITLNTDDRVCVFGQPLHLKISSIDQVMSWIDQLTKLIHNINSKIIISSKDINQFNDVFEVQNINTNLIYGDDIISINISHVYIRDKIEILNTELSFDQIKSFIKKISFQKEETVLLDSTYQSKDFDIISSEITIRKNNNCVDIIFRKTNATNINHIVLYITELIKKFKSDQNEPSQSNVNLIVNESKITMKHGRYNFCSNIKKGTFCITTTTIKDIDSDILMNGYLVTQIKASYLSSNLMKIDYIKVYLDPEIFDQFNYLFGTLDPESQEESETSNEETKLLTDAMSMSQIADSVEQLENIINHTTNDILKNATGKKLMKSFSDLRYIMIDDYLKDEVDPEGLDLKIWLETLHIHLFDKLVIYEENKNKSSFMCIIFKNISFSKIIEKDLLDKIDKINYITEIKTGLIVDVSSRNSDWKYFTKFARSNMLRVNLTTSENSCKIYIKINPFILNIREETLLRLLAFFSASHQSPYDTSPLSIEYFNIGEIHLTLNYCPIILKKIGISQDSLAIKNYNLILSQQCVSDINGINTLIKGITANWEKEINSRNIFQFIPNIKAISPYAIPIIHIIELTTKYFKHARNKKKIRSLIKNIGYGKDLVTSLIRYNLVHIYDFFN